MMQPHFEGRKVNSAESPEASGTVGELRPEQVEQLQNAIAEKTKLAEALRKEWKVKFEEFKELKASEERQQAKVLELKLAGNLNLTDEDIKESRRNSLAQVEEAGHRAERYLEDAREAEREVEDLQARLQDRGN